MIAGGTEVMPRVTTRATGVTRLVSLRHAGLSGIEVDAGRAVIGAATTLAQVGRDERLAVLGPVVESIASPTIRNLATVGGNLFVEQPYGDFAVALLALDAEVDVTGPNESSSRPVGDVLGGGLTRGEVVTAVAFDVPEPGDWFYTKAMRRRQNSASIVTVAAVVEVEGGTVALLRIALGGAGARPVRAASAEAALLPVPLRPRARRRRGKRGPGGRQPVRRRLRERLVSPARPARPHPPRPAWARRPSRGGEPMKSRVIELVVNDEPREFLAPPGTTLLTALRESLGLTAAKRGCSQGTCGTCTCLLDGDAVMSCLVPVETIDGAEVHTLEGMGGPDGELDELQAAFLEGFATQCGFCTSGMIMAARALLAEQPDPSREDVVRAISGNVCRCTGYESIINAILDAAARRGATGAIAHREGA